MVAALIIAVSAVAGIVCAKAVNSHTAERPVIVIDAGHGGVDAGVYGRDSGVKESDINLAVCRELADLFRSAGFNAVLTRSSQAGLYGQPTKGFKMRDLNARREIIERCSADMVISVHQNTFKDTKRRGAQVFYYPSSGQGKQLAECIQRTLNDTPLGDDKKALAADYFMLRCTPSPSVVVECGFLSNSEDEKLLVSEDGRRQAAYAIFAGAVSFLS